MWEDIIKRKRDRYMRKPDEAFNPFNMSPKDFLPLPEKKKYFRICNNCNTCSEFTEHSRPHYEKNRIVGMPRSYMRCKNCREEYFGEKFSKLKPCKGE